MEGHTFLKEEKEKKEVYFWRKGKCTTHFKVKKKLVHHGHVL
jgi:hypothetical protein